MTYNLSQILLKQLDYLLSIYMRQSHPVLCSQSLVKISLAHEVCLLAHKIFGHVAHLFNKSVDTFQATSLIVVLSTVSFFGLNKQIILSRKYIVYSALVITAFISFTESYQHLWLTGRWLTERRRLRSNCGGQVPR